MTHVYHQARRRASPSILFELPQEAAFLLKIYIAYSQSAIVEKVVSARFSSFRPYSGFVCTRIVPWPVLRTV